MKNKCSRVASIIYQNLVVFACIGVTTSRMVLRTHNLPGPQVVHTLTYNDSEYKTSVGYSAVGKHTVREFVKSNGAVAGINGGDAIQGWITRLRVDNQDIVTKNSMVENGLQDEDANGVLGIDHRGKVYIFKSQDFEKYNVNVLPTFLFSGPLLVLDSQIQNTSDTSWNHVRNPRTAVCTTTTADLVKFVVVDGRSERALGMTIPEFATFLQSAAGCRHAINLDGGGSSTMYTKNRGLVNTPMSKTSDGGTTVVERSVSNAILIFYQV